MNSFKTIPAGDSAFFFQISDQISSDISHIVLGFHHIIIEKNIHGISESVPSYTGLVIYFDPLILTMNKAIALVSHLYPDSEDEFSKPRFRLINLPLCYGNDFGPDLSIIAKKSGLSPDEIIAIHSSSEYVVHMIGFTPGFPYLGGLDPRLMTSRKSLPRLKVKAGSLGIAGLQTGIYPIDSPGGWQIIGKTPLSLFNPEEKEAFLFRAGDCVKFIVISLNEYFEISEAIREGKYVPDIVLNYERN